MKLRKLLSENLEIYCNLYGSNWNLTSARGDLEGKDGKAFGSFAYYNNSLKTKGSIVLTVNVEDRGSKRRVSLDFCVGTPDDDYPLVFARTSKDISPERVDINYILDEVEDEIIESLHDTVSSLDFGSVIGAMVDGARGFIGDIQDSVSTDLRMILNNLDSRDVTESFRMSKLQESRVDLRGKLEVVPSVEYDGGFFEKDGEIRDFTVDAGKISGEVLKSEFNYARLTIDGFDIIMISPESDARLFKNLSRALEKFSDNNYVGELDLIDSFEEFCEKYEFTDKIETWHVN